MSPKHPQPAPPAPLPRRPAKAPWVSTTAGPSSAPLLWPRVGLALFVLLGVAVPLGYVLYTGHIWEDYFITFRHSRNLVEGKGLLYNPPDRVHGFTSPLGVLLPAAFYALTGRGSYEPALWLFRMVSILAYVGGGLLVLRRLGCIAGRGVAAAAFAVLYLLDVKAVAFSVNGMETGFMLLFVGWCIYLWGSSHRWAWLARGLAWAGLMWTRPDGCVYIAATALGEWAFAGVGRRWPLWRSWLCSGVLAAVVYLPWFSWAWWYYGSPVPQTIRAKAPVGFEYSVGSVLATLYQWLPHRAASVFAPVYFPLLWSEPEWMYWFVYTTGVFCLVYWLLPVSDRVGRTASLCFTALCAYLGYVSIQFPWYFPPIALCGLVVLGRGLTTLATAAAGALAPRRSPGRLAPVLTGVAVLPVAAGMLGLFDLTVRQIKPQQAVIENGHRKQIGLWLGERVRPDDTVFLEPLGYIGYFSGARMRDWPGLVDPEVAAIRHQGLWHDAVVARLKPTWLVLRPDEARSVWHFTPVLREEYEPVKLFDVSGQLDAVRRQSGPIPGKAYLEYDQTFLVFRRKDSMDPHPSPEESQDAERCRQYFLEQVLKRPVTATSGGFFRTRR